MKRKEDNEDSEEVISYDKLEYNEYDNEEFNKLASLLEVLHTKKNNENCIDELLNNVCTTKSRSSIRRKYAR